MGSIPIASTTKSATRVLRFYCIKIKIAGDIVTDKEKAKRRFFASDDEVISFIPPCAVCAFVDGINCKALKGKRPEKYYNNSNPNFQKCPEFSFNPKAHLANEFKRLNPGFVEK